MHAHTLPAAAGWRWIVGGFAIFRRNPPLFALLVQAYFAASFLNLLPVIGTLLAALAMPGLSVGLMQVARNLELRRPAGLATLFGGLRENPRTLCALGGLYLLCMLGILGISALADGGNLFHALAAETEAEREALANTDMTASIAVVVLLMTPLLMAYWFAPVLAAWHRLSLAKSLFFSFVACLLNWRAFLVYLGGVLLVGGLLPGLLLSIVLLPFPGAQSMVGGMAMALMVFFVAPVLFASFYVAYRDIFGVSEVV